MNWCSRLLKTTVERQWRHLEYPAQRLVERRRGLDPAPVQVQFGVTVHGEHLAAQQFQQARRGQVIAHIGQTDTRGNAAMPGASSEQVGLGYAVGLTARQRMAGLQCLRIETEGIGVVTNLVTYREI